MKYLFLVILITSALGVKAQNETYYAKQMQKEVGSRFEPLGLNPIFRKIVFLESGIQITTGNFKIYLVKYNEVNKVSLQDGAYRYEFVFDIMDVALFFDKLPNEVESPKLIFAMLKIPSKGTKNEDNTEYFRIVFHDFLVINN